MNQLDKKILETLGWKRETIEFQPSNYMHWHPPTPGWRSPTNTVIQEDSIDITTDMLIEAACKSKYVGWAYDATDDADSTHRVTVHGNSAYKATFPDALRAALAAHWGVSDE